MKKPIGYRKYHPGTQPAYNYPPYRSSILRHPSANLELVDPETIELASPAFGHRDVHWTEFDLTSQVNGEPQGERMIVTGKVMDADGHPVAGQLVEIWQANAGGRYRQKKERHPAPLDPNFIGVGRVLTDADGTYTFVTIKPGPYPWPNHQNAWRPGARRSVSTPSTTRRPAWFASITVSTIAPPERAVSSLSRCRLSTRSEPAVSTSSTSMAVSVFQNARVLFGSTKCLASPSIETMAKLSRIESEGKMPLARRSRAR